MNPEQSIREEIAQVVRDSPANRYEGSDEPYFENPLVQFASARDPLFERYKEIVGEFHLTPRVFFEDAFGEGSFDGGTVVCWVLPVAQQTRITNRREDRIPSRQWAHQRNFGEKFNNELRQAVVSFLTGLGARAVAPMLSAKWQMLRETPVGIASTWSERHAAYAAGLGTFSINDGLITPRGIAHRVGSVVTDLVLPPSPRPYTDHRENCLLFRGQECGACIQRCPGDALSEQGHDKDRCLEYAYGTILEEVKKYGVDFAGCGLCQTAVPCESRIPAGKKEA